MVRAALLLFVPVLLGLAYLTSEVMGTGFTLGFNALALLTYAVAWRATNQLRNVWLGPLVVITLFCGFIVILLFTGGPVGYEKPFTMSMIPVTSQP